MQISSEGPTKITKAVIDAAWRRRGPSRRLIIRDKDCRGLALIVNAIVYGMELRLSSAWNGSTDGTTLAKQGIDAWQSKHAFAG